MDKRELVRRHYADVLLGLCKDHRLRDLTVADVVEVNAHRTPPVPDRP